MPCWARTSAPRSNNSVLALLHRLSGAGHRRARTACRCRQAAWARSARHSPAAARAAARRFALVSPVSAHHAGGRSRLRGRARERRERLTADIVVSQRRSCAHAARASRRAPSRDRLRAPRPASAHERHGREAASRARWRCPRSRGLGRRARRRASGHRARSSTISRQRSITAKYGDCSRAAGAGDHHPERARPDAGARRQTRLVGGRAVRAVRPACQHATPPAPTFSTARSACSSATRRACAARSLPRSCCCRRISSANSASRGGHWHHGELALDQFLMLRPDPGAAQYAMPVNGLYLCGAGAHPGGGVMGCAGKNAAQAVF